MATFWPIYFMLVYTIVGLWAGQAFRRNSALASLR